MATIKTLLLILVVSLAVLIGAAGGASAQTASAPPPPRAYQGPANIGLPRTGPPVPQIVLVVGGASLVLAGGAVLLWAARRPRGIVRR